MSKERNLRINAVTVTSIVACLGVIASIAFVDGIHDTPVGKGLFFKGEKSSGKRTGLVVGEHLNLFLVHQDECKIVRLKGADYVVYLSGFEIKNWTTGKTTITKAECQTTSDLSQNDAPSTILFR